MEYTCFQEWLNQALLLADLWEQFRKWETFNESN